MSTTFSRVFMDSTVGVSPVRADIQRHIPMLNVISTSAAQYLNSVEQTRRKKYLMQWYKQIPELTGFINKVARDVTGRYSFENVNDLTSGRNKIIVAERFAKKVQQRRLMKEQVIDGLVTGEAFGWLGKIKEADLKHMIRKTIDSNYLIQYKSKSHNNIEDELLLQLKSMNGKASELGIDEDILRPRMYRNVPSTTMEVMYDKYDIIGYKQIVGMHIENYSPDEIIRYTFMNIDGKPNGFTPVESLVVQLELLRFMWQNMLSIHKNGGQPDKIISLENVRPDSPQYKRIEDQLLKYKAVENKHGNMLFTGKIQIEDLNQLESMQFKDMGLYITGLLAMQWGIPRSSIPYILGESNAKADVGGEAERNYWECIRDIQKIYAEIMNTQLWEPYFGVKIVFENSFVHRDIQKETAKMNKLNNLLTENQLLATVDKQLNQAIILKELGRDTSQLETKRVEPMDTQPLMGNQPKKDLPSDEDANRSAAKRDEQQATIASRGTNPSGVGKERNNDKPNDKVIRPALKEFDNDAEIEYKGIIGNEPFVVDMKTFVKLYNEDKAYNPGKPPRIFVRENDMFITYIYKSSDFVYKTILKSEELESYRISIMKLGTDFYKL